MNGERRAGHSGAADERPARERHAQLVQGRRAMLLRVHAPTRTVVNEPVSKVVAEAANGLFCLLPAHVDFTAALVAGILYFDDAEGRTRYVAVDQGILVKRGPEVMVSCFEAVAGSDLDELQRMVAARYLELDEDERLGRSALARLEAGALRGLFELEQWARHG